MQDPNDRPRPVFSRSADGRLRAGGGRIAPVPREDQLAALGQPSGGTDVGDMWSEQERIRLQEVWEEAQKKAARKRRLKERWTGSSKPEPVANTKRVDRVVPVKPTEDPKEITLNISLPSVPKISMPHLSMPNFSKKQIIILAVSITVVVAACAGGYVVYTRNDKPRQAAAGADANVTTEANGVKVRHLDPSQLKGTPDYDTILPEGKTIEDFGGWVRVSPEDKEPVYAYADSIGSVLINVSEQRLPDTFRNNTVVSMESLAKQFSANDKVTAGGLTVYIGTSSKGPQSVLFTKGDTLILIKSASKIENDQWVSYIKTLR